MRSILLVDARSGSAHLTQTLLERDGFEVTAARDVAHARTLLAGHAFDGIVLDLVAPGGSGLSLLGFRLGTPNRRSPTVVVTGLRQRHNVRRCFALGATAVLERPFDPEELVRNVREMVPGKRDGLTEGRRVA